jgi:hypothetical protein
MDEAAYEAMVQQRMNAVRCVAYGSCPVVCVAVYWHVARRGSGAWIEVCAVVGKACTWYYS